MHIKKSTAFTLIEIVVAMLILSLVAAGTFALFASSHKFINEAGHRLQAIYYAKRVAETLKVYISADSGTPPNAGTAFNNSAFASIGLASSVTDPNSGIVYNLAYTVSNPISGSELKSVTITTTWNEP